MSNIFDVYVGTYSETVLFTSGKIVHGKGRGIHQLAFDADNGVLEPVSYIEGVRNPSYIARSKNGKFLYSANEVRKSENTPCGSVSAFAIDPESGNLHALGSRLTEGDDPNYITADSDGKAVYVSNYASGSVAVFPIEGDGSLGPLAQLFPHEGKNGPHPTRQKQPYAHSVVLSPNEKFLYVPDLGIDKIMVYERDVETGMLTPRMDLATPAAAGAGPRHADFAPKANFFYLINELDCTFTAYSWNPETGKLTPLQTIPTLLTPYDKDKTCADIHVSPDGRFLYGTTRGICRILVCALHPETGLMTPIQEEPTGGDVPRNFVIDPSGHFLLIAHQNSDNIVIFAIDEKTGKLTRHREYASPTPVCLKIYPKSMRGA
jgi:6-phosphogluconolactonase